MQVKEKKSLLWLTVFLGTLAAMAPLSTDMYLPSLPFMPEEFGVGISMIQLTLTMTMAGMAIGQIFAGPISDMKGRRLPLIVGMGVFALSSLVCVFATSITVFLVFRFIQGLAGAAGIVIARAIARDICEGPQLTKFFSMLMLVNGLAPILAPVIGGQILLFTSWRGIFALLAVIGVLMAGVMGAGWAWERARRDATIVDVLWAAGMGLAALVFAAGGSGAALPRVLLALLAGGWALRLAVHLALRARGRPEDGRYRHLRRHWGDRGGPFLLLFLGQALLVVLFALPFAAVAANPVADFTAWTALGVAVWLAAIIGETTADRQLARFRADPVNRGRTCDTGLWRWSRHPNYFFEWLQWFAYVFLSVGSPLHALSWTGPLLMYLFLRYLSGIPWTEAQALRTRGEDYRRYRERTPMLFPWFPRDPDRRS